MRLTDLDPFFARYETRVESYKVCDGDLATWRERGCPVKDVVGPREYTIRVASFADAQGIRFQCPKCFNSNAGGGQGHYVDVTFADRGVLPSQGCHNDKGEPTRWNVSGSDFTNLTTTPSILVVGGCGWHGYLTNGEAN